MTAKSVRKLSRALMRLMARLMPSCKNVTQLVSESLDRKLPRRKRFSIRLHLSLCALCRRYEKQLHLLREGARRYGDPESNAFLIDKTLSPTARQRLKNALEQRS